MPENTNQDDIDRARHAAAKLLAESGTDSFLIITGEGSGECGTCIGGLAALDPAILAALITAAIHTIGENENGTVHFVPRRATCQNREEN